MRAGMAIVVGTGLLALIAATGSVVGTSAQGPPVLIFASDRAPDRNPEVYSLSLSAGARRDLSGNALSDTVVAIHGKRVAFESDRKGVALYVAQIGSTAPARKLVALAPGAVDFSGSFSPAGAELAVALTLRTKGVSSYVVDLFTGTGRRLARLPNATLAPGSSPWSADGRQLAYAVGPPGQQRHVIRVVDARGRLQFTQRGDSALWAPAAPRLAIVSGTFSNTAATDGSTTVVDEQGQVIRQFAGRALAFSPDGTTLVLTRKKRAGWLAAVDTGVLTRLSSGEAAAFSPDGAHLELPSVKGEGAVIQSVSTGSVEGHLSRFGTWLADSRRLVFLSTASIANLVTINGHLVRRLMLVPPGEATTTFTVASAANALVYTVQSYLPHQLYEQPASGAPRQLTHGSADHLEPAPSPDGKLIADAEFDTPCGICAPPQIAVLLAGGSTPAQVLPNQAGGNSYPTWSPDGAQIAYGEDAAPDIDGIFVMGSDGSSPVALAGGVGARQPSWSPDGTTIAASHNGIVLMAPDGSGAHQLIGPVPAHADIDQAYAPTWSPDSTKIAFVGADGLYLIGRDGSGLHRIVAMRRMSDAAWAPDGALIAFATACQTNAVECVNHRTNDIWTVAPDGSNLHRITDDVADDATPAWLPGP